jgi:hypothetical protein
MQLPIPVEGLALWRRIGKRYFRELGCDFNETVSAESMFKVLEDQCPPLGMVSAKLLTSSARPSKPA